MKKKAGAVITNIILAVSIAVAVFSAWKLWGFYQKYHKGEEEYNKLTDYVNEKDDDTGKKTETDDKKSDVCPITVDFDALQEINEDVVGWIYIPGTEINYPVVQGDNNEYYLHRTFEKKDNFTGAIFMDSLCQLDFSSDNTILYGHNMKNGTMFGYLKRTYDTGYDKDADWSNHRKMWLLSPDAVREYELFAARRISAKADVDVYTVECGTPEEYEAFQKEQKENSIYDTGIKPDKERPMLTLSTCTSDSEDGRFVVQALLLQKTNP